jgi:hypothetical protein
MHLGEFANVTVNRLICFLVGRVFALHLNRAQHKVVIDPLRNDEIEAFISVRKVDVPASICQTASDVQFREVIGDFHLNSS